MVFEKLERIVEIQVEYESKSSLAIQAGREEGLRAVEQPVIRVGGQTVLPGSSLKGVLRSLLESLLSQNGILVCVPEAAIPLERKKQKNGIQEYVKEIGRKEPCKIDDLCPVCEIFGSAEVSSRAVFLDARPTTEPKLLERRHVAITRDTKTAAGGALLEVETVDAGTTFNGTIRVINPEKWHIGALITAVENLRSLGLGSKKSEGYGEIAATIVDVTPNIMKEGKWVPEEVTIDQYKDAFLKYLREQ